MPLFYRTTRPRSRGELKVPTWGPTVLSTGTAHPFYNRELAFETARQLIAPSAPSRLAATFAFPTLEFLQRWDWGTEAAPILVYRVEPTGPTFEAEMAWLTSYRTAGDNRGRETAAASYWRGESVAGGLAEVLSAWPLRIEELVETIDPTGGFRP